MSNKRIIAISDTHNFHKSIKFPELKEDDILVHAGDATMRGTLTEYKRFIEWYSSLTPKTKIYVPGNHDFICQDSSKKVKILARENGVDFLLDSSLVISGVKFYGSPWQPWYHNWAFNFPQFDLEDQEVAKAKWAEIPDDTEVLITHGPPKGIRDKVRYGNGVGTHVGCKQLYNRIVNGLPKLKHHIFGHIHEGYGKSICLARTFHNVALWKHWQGTAKLNKPHIIEI